MFNPLPAKDNPFASRDVVGAASFVIGAEAGNAISVAIQLMDAQHIEAYQRASLFYYLSDDANGDSIIATGVTSIGIGTDGLHIPVVAAKAGVLVSEVDGDIDLSISYTGGAKTCYLVLVMPNGSLVVSDATTFA